MEKQQMTKTIISKHAKSKYYLCKNVMLVTVKEPTKFTRQVFLLVPLPVSTSVTAKTETREIIDFVCFDS